MPDVFAKRNDAVLWVGTSGYSYTEWIEAGFYPPGTRQAAMLPAYARRFPIAELNHTWYQMPRASAVEQQRRKAPDGFLFAAKLTRSLTHDVDPKGWREQAAAYRQGVAPLMETKQLVAVLAQFPGSFERTAANRRHLAQLFDELSGLPLAVEFRHDSWANDRVFAELEKRQVALVATDEPALPGLFPTLDVVTNPHLFYVRFHGRNARGWRSGKMEQQFDYDYSDAELSEWVEKRIGPMASQATRGILFFNNHVRAQAPRNAETLTRLLHRQGLLVQPTPGEP
jgi:uncharacterized protein YecE (DUF72 family)